MRHATVSGAWRPVRARGGRRQSFGAISALAFNLCLLLLPIASAGIFLVIARDRLYAYEASEAGARVIRERVERLNSELIQLDYDRLRLWDDLVAMELVDGDIEAARGFLLSARGMLPARERNQINRRLPTGADDAQLELVAMSLLTPGTRARYQSIVPLLSRRADTPLPGAGATAVGDPQDFELMARALLAEPSTDPLQFVLAGYQLGLAGDGSARTRAGAAALLEASRRDDYPQGFAAEMTQLVNAAVPLESFRSIALAHTSNGDPDSFANIAGAFRGAARAAEAARLGALLSEIGAMSEATSPSAAATLITHAASLRDIAKLRLVAQATGARAAAAAKRLERDGRLIEVARGELTMNRDLFLTIAVAALAFVGLIGILAFRAYRAGRRLWLRFNGEESHDLINLSSASAGQWRPL